MSSKRRSYFSKLLRNRKKELDKDKINRRIARIVIDNLKMGRSICQEEVYPHSLGMFLVRLDATEYALERVEECLDDIDYSQEWLFAVGDYGSGKSQLKNRIQAVIEDRTRGFLISVSANLQEDSLQGFCDQFVEKLKQLVSEEHKEKYNVFQPFFKEYHPDLGKMDRTRIITTLIKTGVESGLRFFMQFDEIDQIPNLEEFRPWGSLIRSLNDQIRKGLVGIVFIAEREITRLWQKDRRLTTLSTFLAAPLDPGSHFGSKYQEGIANILALYDLAYTGGFDTRSIALLESFQDFHKERLKSLTLREFNIGAYLLCQSLHEFEKAKIWQKIDNLHRRDRTEIGQTAEKALMQLIRGFQLHFNVEGERYSAELLTERLRRAGWESDGTVLISKDVEGESITYLELPVEVKYTLRSYHESGQLKDIEIRTKTLPTIFFSIGPNELGREKLKDRFKNQLISGKLVIVDIDRDLFLPVLSYDESMHLALSTTLRNWLLSTSRLRQLILPFLENLVGLQYRKEIEELRAEIERIKALSTAVPTPAARESYFNVAVALVALFNQTTTGRKRKNSLPKHVMKQLDAPVNNFKSVYQTVVQELLSRGYLEETTATYATTNAWKDESTRTFCEEMKQPD